MFQLRLVEDIHEGDPEVGREEVPDCRPQLPPDHRAALLEELLPDDPGQRLQDVETDLLSDQPQTQLL